MTSEVSEAKTIHPVPRYASWLTALRYADDLHVECVRLTAENARLRQAIVDSLAEWRRGQEQIDYANLPPHIVILQRAIERRESE